MSIKIQLGFNQEESDVMDDDEIADFYSGYSILELRWNKSMMSGYICLEKVFDDEGGDNHRTFTDNFLLHDDSGRVAFDNWYPEKEYERLCEYITMSKLFAILNNQIENNSLKTHFNKWVFLAIK